MNDVFTVLDLRELAKEQAKRADEYCIARRAAGEAKVKLDLILTAYLPGIRMNKPNAGIEMAHQMLMERCAEAKEYYEIWQKEEANYKGLEKLLEAYASRIMLEMSILKRQAEGEKWGA
jgi:hypothetical protein